MKGHKSVNHIVKIREKEKGFSLAELAIMVSMMAIVMSFSIPKVSSAMRNMQLAADARNISATLRYAKLSATAQMTRYRLTFDLAGNSWSLERFNRDTNVFELQLDVNKLSSGIAHSGIAFKNSSSSAPDGFPTTSSAFIEFNSRGIPINGTGVPVADNIVYLSGNNSDYAVSVSLAGKVQLWKCHDGQWAAQ